MAMFCTESFEFLMRSPPLLTVMKKLIAFFTLKCKIFQILTIFLMNEYMINVLNFQKGHFNRFFRIIFSTLKTFSFVFQSAEFIKKLADKVGHKMFPKGNQYPAFKLVKILLLVPKNRPNMRKIIKYLTIRKTEPHKKVGGKKEE